MGMTQFGYCETDSRCGASYEGCVARGEDWVSGHDCGGFLWAAS